MKTNQFLAMLLLTVSTVASAQKSELNLSKSQIKWTGNKIGGSHNGEIKVKSGYLEVSEGQIKKGKVVIDMNSISNHDLTDKGYNQKLVDHLKSDDFFGVANHPVAVFEVKSADAFKNGKANVSGNITIKGHTETISFEVVKKGNSFFTTLKVDRSKFNVRYGSNSFFDNLGDKAIDDIFILDIQLVL